VKGDVRNWVSFVDPKMTHQERIKNMLENIDQQTEYFEGSCSKVTQKF
jgi:hypothetical protein